MRIPLRRPDASGIALTFDDGPHPSGTPAVLDLLAAADISATFYLVGEQVERWPELAERIAAEGHEVGLHGYRHTLLLRRTPRGLLRDLLRAAAVIEHATGVAPRSYRPPYGVFNTFALGLVRHRGWEPMLWSRWGRDWGAHERPQDIARRATRSLGGGDVILLHDADHYSAPGCWRQMVAALPSILSACAATGLPAVSVTQST
jgi:peptidoglycan/xylan/chitin deacetylase (PgdA/CDA1 family)